jgi:hypothetical protein
MLKRNRYEQLPYSSPSVVLGVMQINRIKNHLRKDMETNTIATTANFRKSPSDLAERSIKNVIAKVITSVEGVVGETLSLLSKISGQNIKKITMGAFSPSLRYCFKLFVEEKNQLTFKRYNSCIDDRNKISNKAPTVGRVMMKNVGMSYLAHNATDAIYHRYSLVLICLAGGRAGKVATAT